MKIKEIIKSLEKEITRLRESVCDAGDTADVVYLGEDIGKLQVIISLLESYSENNEVSEL